MENIFNKIKRNVGSLIVAVLALVSANANAIPLGAGGQIHGPSYVEVNGVQQFVINNDMFIGLISRTAYASSNVLSLTVNTGETITIPYTIVNNSNGTETFNIEVSSNDTSVEAPIFAPIAPLTLGAAVSSNTNVTDNEIFIAPGTGDGFEVGDVLVIEGIDGGTYEVLSITQGTIASTTTTGVYTAPVDTVIVLQPLDSSPIITAGSVGPELAIGEQGTFDVIVSVNDLFAGSTNGSIEIDIGGSSVAGAPIENALDVSQVVLNIIPGVIFTKEARNFTRGDLAFATESVTADVGEIIEYQITVDASTGYIATGAAVQDDAPLGTHYVPDTTSLNGINIPDLDGGGTALSQDGGLLVNSLGEAGGEVHPDNPAVVTFRVCVGESLSECEI